MEYIKALVGEWGGGGRVYKLCGGHTKVQYMKASIGPYGF